MTVSTQTSENRYFANGVTTVFPFTFPTIEASHIFVDVVQSNGAVTQLVRDTDYTVINAGFESGGSVSLNVAPPAGTQVVIRRVVPLTQPFDFKNQGSFYPATHERSFDRIVMILQQLSVGATNSISLSALGDAWDARGLPITAAGDARSGSELVTLRQAQAILEAGIEGQFFSTPRIWRFTGDGTTQIFPIAGADVSDVLFYEVVVGGLQQEPTDAFSVNINADPLLSTVTLTSPPPNGVEGFVLLRAYAQPFAGTLPIAQAVVTVGPDASTPNGRQLAASSPIQLADSGPGGAITISLTPTQPGTVNYPTAPNNRITGLTVDRWGRVSSVSTAAEWSMTNVGASGARVFKQLTGSQFELRRIVAGSGVTVTEGTDQITIAATGGGGGGGATVLDDLNDVDMSLPWSGFLFGYNSDLDIWGPTAVGSSVLLDWRAYDTNGGDGNPFDGDMVQWSADRALWINGKFRRPVITVTGATAAVGRSNVGCVIRSTNAGGITVTLSNDAYNEGEVGNEGKVGESVIIFQDQSGGVTFTLGSGVSADYTNVTSTSNAQGQLIECFRIAPNRYVVSRLNAAGGGGGAVSSVNGSTGAVVLTSNSINHDQGQSATVRTTQAKLRDWASITDWGAVGDNTTNNAAAFAAAEASTYRRIYVPEGTYYFNASQNTLSKHYFGPGRIRDNTSSWAPGRFTWLTSRPTTGTGSDIDFFFSGDNSRNDAEYFLLGSSGNNLRKGLSEPYFESVTTPHFQTFQNFSGWSGTDARLTAGISAGATSLTVNDATGISIGNTIRIVNINTGFEESRSITNKVGNVLTLSSGTSSAHPAGSFVGTGQRTMNPLYHQYFIHRGGGDSYAILARGVGAYSALAGQDHIFFTATTGLFGGDLSANAPHQFLTGIEIDHKDLSNQCGAVGAILNFQRTNAATTRGEFWHGILIKSEGSIAIDSGVCLIGPMRTGVDLANSNANYDAWRAAVSMKRGDGVVFNSQTVVDTLGSGLSNPYSLTARAIGSTLIRTNEGAADPYDANAAKAGDLEFRLQDGLGSRLSATASPGASSVTVASSARAQALVPGQSVVLFDPTNSNNETRTVVSVSGTTVNLTPTLTNGYTAGSVLQPAGESNTARFRFYVRGVETMTVGNQVSILRQLNVQNIGGSEVTGLNLTNNTNITSHSFPAGGATALPATPRLYIPIKLDGTVYYVPAYN